MNQSHLYNQILGDIALGKSVTGLMRMHHLNCLAEYLKTKFNDPRPIPELRALILAECT